MKYQAIRQGTPLKRGRRFLLIFVLIMVLMSLALLLIIFLMKRNNKESQVAKTITACMDALQSGSLDEALSYSDYAGNIGALLTEITESENFTSSNVIESAFIQVLGGTQEWQGVLKYALSAAVQTYQITKIECEEDYASVNVEIVSPDFIAAASMSGDDILELLKDSYGGEEIINIIKRAATAYLLPNALTIGNAVKELISPIYDQWPAYVKKSIDAADTRTITVVITLKIENGKWVVLSNDFLAAIEKYAAEAARALIPDLGK